MEGITKAKVEVIQNEMGKVVIGQKEAIKHLLMALFAGGHVLLEGVPGIAKTLLAKTLAYVCDLDFKRVQFTPDLMPSDILGTNVFDMNKREFNFIKGPIFTDIFLADEINRTPPKTQSALLEAMQEKQVTIEGNEYKLDDAFFVIATQNPVEYEGTYHLPEAQADRFLMKIKVDYPTSDEEKDIYKVHTNFFDIFKEKLNDLKKVISREDIKKIREEIKNVKLEEQIYEYVSAIITATRQSQRLMLGASPRAGIAIIILSKLNALFNDRDYIIPDDIKYVAYPVLRHRIILKPEAEMEFINEDRVIDEILSEVKVPR
ncbi:MoxR family ATPase [bacterium]|nr:MoxR family ATPase [bacterium]